MEHLPDLLTHCLPPLDLAPYIIRPGNRVTASRVESERARKAYAHHRTQQLRKAREMFACG